MTAIVSVFFATLVILLAMAVAAPVFFGAPWHPASREEVQRILNVCGAVPGEKLYDLGSGDGRVLITAARDFGLTGVGLEIDPLKVLISRLLIRRLGLGDRVKVLWKNVFRHDYQDADILFIYLSHQALDRLFPKIFEQLKPTAKIICYRFCLRGVPPEKTGDGGAFFLYRVPKGGKLDRYS